MDMKRALVIIAIFLGGLLAGHMLTASDGFSTPIYNGGYELPGELYSGITGKAIERISPSNHLNEKQILVYNDRVVLDLKNVIFAKFTNTNSMDPVIDDGANALEVAPSSPDDIKEGDIIAYTNECTNSKVIIHRIIRVGKDQLGTYYILKGDNNAKADPCKVRFNEVQSVVVGILY